MTRAKTVSCVTCQFLRFHEGSPYYSELTPGSPMSLSCDKDHWNAENMSGASDLRRSFLSAEKCPDYLQIPEDSGEGPWDDGF